MSKPESHLVVIMIHLAKQCSSFWVADEAKWRLGQPVSMQWHLYRHSLKTAYMNYLSSLSTLLFLPSRGNRLLVWCWLVLCLFPVRVNSSSIGQQWLSLQVCRLTGHCIARVGNEHSKASVFLVTQGKDGKQNQPFLSAYKEGRTESLKEFWE